MIPVPLWTRSSHSDLRHSACELRVRGTGIALV